VITYMDKSIRVDYADLQYEQRGTRGTMRYRCPIHGGNGYSLAINNEGDFIGTGRCFNAGCPGKEKQVVVPDYPGRKPYHKEKPMSPEEWAKLVLHSEPAKVATVPLDNEPSPELLALRSAWPRMQRQARINDRAREYLIARGLKPEILDVADIGYIPDVDLKDKTNISEKWRDRLIFPLMLPNGPGGYASRCLWGWVPGMDERTHKDFLTDYGKGRRRNNHTRHQKSAGMSGWYGLAADDLADTLYIVEGVFDRLSLIRAGIDPNEVIAVVGTAVPMNWIPKQTERVILAFDGDEAGRKKATEVEYQLKTMGVSVLIATAPNDNLGKDASERFRLAGSDGLQYLIDAWVEITSM
jgi:5S rRNA maturation endonuclease (ribonuclease M5)